MNVLVVNIGSTSFKFRLYDTTTEHTLAHGEVDGVGRPTARIDIRAGDHEPIVREEPIADHTQAIARCLEDLIVTTRIDAVGFKAVHGGHLSDAVPVTPEVLAVMREFTEAAPAHNPPYVAAMEAFAAQLPDTPLVAAFETGFHQTIPASRQTYAVPWEWTEALGVRRYGFHGASHRYVATRCAELLGRTDLRVISCHLGGSSSLCAIAGGKSVANSFGMTPQTGLPQNNRVGDFDPYALLTLKSRTGLETEQLLQRMSREGGLLGISGISGDMREVLAAAPVDRRAALAVDVFVESVRHYLGAYVVALGGLDALVFTGGMGLQSSEVRRRVCDGLEFLGIAIDPDKNAASDDASIVSPDGSPVTVMVLRTNEELIVARQTRAVVERDSQVSSRPSI